MNDQVRQTLLAAVEREIAASWQWEKHNRYWMIWFTWISWGARLILLALASYQVSAFVQKPPPTWFSLLLTVLALLGLAVPHLATLCRFQQRQQVHDVKARAYEVLKTKLLTGQTSVADATKQYEDIMRRSPEVESRSLA